MSFQIPVSLSMSDTIIESYILCPLLQVLSFRKFCSTVFFVSMGFFGISLEAPQKVPTPHSTPAHFSWRWTEAMGPLSLLTVQIADADSVGTWKEPVGRLRNVLGGSGSGHTRREGLWVWTAWELQKAQEFYKLCPSKTPCCLGKRSSSVMLHLQGPEMCP